MTSVSLLLRRAPLARLGGALALLLLIAAPAAAQVDLEGEWGALNGVSEDQPHRVPGAYLGDYTGLPINDAARLKARSWDASILSQPERQAQPHPAQYSVRGGGGPNLRITKVLDPVTAQDRTTAQLAVVFGGVALLLAAIGLYGVLSHGIARRTAEIAIRVALGAHPGRVVSMILGETGRLVGAGLAVGGGLAYVASSLIGERLYGVPPEDPLTLAAATGLLLAVAFAAAYGPARRASRLDPATGLRQE